MNNSVLIQNVNIFDGKKEELIMNMSVLVEGNKIAKIASSIQAPEGATVIDGGYRTMTPGIVSTHEHIMMQLNFMEFYSTDTRYSACVSTVVAKNYLMNGWTTIRDCGGNAFSLKKAIDSDMLMGPRIIPCGAMISQTGGHSDHRFDAHGSALVGGTPDPMVLNDDMMLADGVPEVLKAARESLRRGANFVKICTGGGYGSFADPLEVVQYSPEEIQAAVKAAEDYKTYVATHCYNNEGIVRAIENGVKSIEHGNFLDETTLNLMKAKDVWLSPQVSAFINIIPGTTEEQIRKCNEAFEYLDNMFTLCKKVGFENITFGTDIVANIELLKRGNEEFMHRTKWFSPIEIMRQATSKSGELIGMSKRFNPGKIGVIEEGALADILIMNGNPLNDLSVMTRPEENLAVIMKDGKIYKNTINQ